MCSSNGNRTIYGQASTLLVLAIMFELSGCVDILICAFQLSIAVKLFVVITRGECRSQKFLLGRTAVVSGGNSGMGYIVAENLASRGCKVIIGDVVDAQTTVNKIIASTSNKKVFYKYVDFASLDSIRKFAGNIIKTENRLDILINNAGIGGFEGDYTSDKLLKIMQVNYFAHFLLTHLLVGLLQKTESSRVVFVSSALAFTHSVKNADNINNLNNASSQESIWSYFSPKTVTDYGSSKLCLLMASNHFAQKLKPYGVTVAAVHPGYVRTGIFDKTKKNSHAHPAWHIIHLAISWLVTKTAYQGAAMVLDVGLSEDIQPGGFYWDNINFWQPPAFRNVALCEEIWRKSESLVELKDEEKLDYILKHRLSSEK